MKTRNEIIEELYHENFVERVLNTLGTHYFNDSKEDVTAELWLMVCEIQEDKIIKLYNNNELMPYICTIVKNQIMNNDSKIHKKYFDTREISMGIMSGYYNKEDEIDFEEDE